MEVKLLLKVQLIFDFERIIDIEVSGTRQVTAG